MTGQVTAPPRKPLPVIVKPIVDELLSSWLHRTAQSYGTSVRDVLTHFGIWPPDLPREIDFYPSLEVRARLAWGLRTNSARIQRAGHPVSFRCANGFIAKAEPLSQCLNCDGRWRARSASGPISRSWYEAWQVSCGFCHRPFHIGSAFTDQKKGPRVPDGLWQDAINGSKLVERYLVGQPCGWLPPRLIWTLTSIPIRSRQRVRVAFGLIVPEASHPAYGALHLSSSKTCRTGNPFRRLAFLAALHRFDQEPHEWLQAFFNAATEMGKAAISKLLLDLPHGIGHELLKINLEYTTQRRELLYACRTIGIVAQTHQAMKSIT